MPCNRTRTVLKPNRSSSETALESPRLRLCWIPIEFTLTDSSNRQLPKSHWNRSGSQVDRKLLRNPDEGGASAPAPPPPAPPPAQWPITELNCDWIKQQNHQRRIKNTSRTTTLPPSFLLPPSPSPSSFPNAEAADGAEKINNNANNLVIDFFTSEQQFSVN